MDTELKTFIDYIETAKTDLNIQRQIAFNLECNDLTLDIIDKSIALANNLESIAKSGSYKVNYLNQFRSNLDSILGNIPMRGQKDPNIVNQQGEQWKIQVKQQFENQWFGKFLF